MSFLDSLEDVAPGLDLIVGAWELLPWQEAPIMSVIEQFGGHIERAIGDVVATSADMEFTGVTMHDFAHIPIDAHRAQMLADVFNANEQVINDLLDEAAEHGVFGDDVFGGGDEGFAGGEEDMGGGVLDTVVEWLGFFRPR